MMLVLKDERNRCRGVALQVPVSAFESDDDLDYPTGNEKYAIRCVEFFQKRQVS